MCVWSLVVLVRCYKSGVKCNAMMLGYRGGVLVRPSTCVETAVPPNIALHDSDEL